MWLTQNKRLQLGIIFFVAALVRFYHLQHAPNWFTDEATHLEIARQLLAGNTRYFAITDSYLLFARLPAFEWLLALTLRVFPHDMLALRSLSALLGCLTISAAHQLVKQTVSDRGALIVAALLAVHPQIVLYNRFGFSYNLIALLLLLVIYGFVKKEYWWVSALAFGIALLSEVWMLSAIVPFVVLVWWWNRPKFIQTNLITATPLTLYIVWMLTQAPSAFLFDLQYTFSRLGGNALVTQLDTLQTNLTTLTTSDPLFLIGCVGVFFLPAKLRWVIALFLFAPLLSLGRSIALFSLSAYYMIPLWPLLAIGAMGLIEKTMEAIKPATRVYQVIVTCLVLSFGLLTSYVLWQIEHGFPTGVDSFLVDGAAAEAAAVFVNRELNSAELTIASPTIGFLLKENVADFQMIPAYNGITTPHLPSTLSHDRFAFIPSYEAARFVITDPLWHNWATIHVSDTQSQLQRMKTEWPVVFEHMGIRVYENPAHTE